MKCLFKGLRRLAIPALIFLSLPVAAQNDTIEAPIEDGSTVGVHTVEEQTYKDVFEATDSFKLEPRQLPDSLLNNYRKQDDYWYWNYEPKQPKRDSTSRKKPEVHEYKPVSTDWLYYVLGLAVVALIVLLLRSNDVKLFAGRNRKIYGGQADAGKELEAIPFEDEISKAERSGDFRTAIRLQYLEILKYLDQQQWIKYHPDEPNSAYVRQLSGKKNQAPFRRLTLHFDYAWYGNFEISPAMYDLIKADFITFKKQMG